MNEDVSSEARREFNRELRLVKIDGQLWLVWRNLRLSRQTTAEELRELWKQPVGAPTATPKPFPGIGR